jgi:hypothetical protein
VGSFATSCSSSSRSWIGQLCGPRMTGTVRPRGGHTEGELAFGGRRVRVRRPRVHGTDGCEVPLPTWQHFAEADPLTPRAVEQMVLGVSMRNYERSLESPPAGISTRGASKSAVKRLRVRNSTLISSTSSKTLSRSSCTRREP